MTNVDPSWSLTDDALTLILHAENDIVENNLVDQLVADARPGQLGGTVASKSWQRETAILRLVSTVEAYTNSASELFHAKKSLPLPKLPLKWRPDRIKYYKKVHGIELELRDGWESVDAGIDLRNCLAHGLGNLTPLLLSDPMLTVRAKNIDVTVSGNRMYYTATTVPKLARGCRSFVLDIERQLVASL